MVWAVRRVRRETATGFLHVRVGFWRRRADFDRGDPPNHLNDFRFDCPAWPTAETIRRPYDLVTGLLVPRAVVLKEVAYDWREETVTPDVRAHVRDCVRRYVQRMRADLTRLQRDGRDNAPALTASDAYLSRAEIQGLATEMDDDGDA